MAKRGPAPAGPPIGLVGEKQTVNEKRRFGGRDRGEKPPAEPERKELEKPQGLLFGKRKQRAIEAQLAHEAREARRDSNVAFLDTVFNANAEPVTIGGMQYQWDALTGVILGLYCQKGGASKSVSASTTAAMVSMLTGAPTLELAATQNPGSGTMKAGIARSQTRDLLQVEALLLELSENGTKKIDAEDFRKKIRRNKYGVYVIAQSQLPDDFDGKRFRWVLQQLRGMFAFIVADTGNYLGRVGTIEHESAVQADHLVFTAWTGMPDSPVLMGETMDSYVSINNPAKLSRCTTLINGVQGDIHSDEVRRHWALFAEAKVNDYGRPIGVRDFPYRVIKHNDGDKLSGALHLIPYDHYLATMAVPSLSEIADETYDAYLEFIVDTIRRVCVARGLNMQILDATIEAEQHTASFDYVEAMQAQSFPSDDEDDDFPAPTNPPTERGQS